MVRVTAAAVCALLWLAPANAFVPSVPGSSSGRATRLPMAVSTQSKDDVNIENDAAAKLAYDEWRQQFNKGDFDEKRFQNFKQNYEAITVANVKAKKEAREKGGEPDLLTLNEYGDFSEAEYADATKKKSGGMKDVLGKAMEAAESQSAASSALEDAASALAEDEEELVRKLGLNSVEELEAALDSMDGIASDGGKVDKDNLAREARIRSAYLQWCKDFDKQKDETRYKTFANNFLTMENYAEESGKEMQLNQYADCTEDEYKQMQQSGKTPAPSKPPARAPAPAPGGKTSLQKKQEEIRAWQAKSAEERRQQNEKDRQSRQKAQEAELAKMKQEKEEEAIQAAREQTEREAAQAAESRRMDEQAAEEMRKKAKAWEDKQRQLQAKSKSKPVKGGSSGGLDFLSFFPSPAPAKRAAPRPAPRPMAKKPVKKAPAFSLFPAGSPAPKRTPKPAPATAKKAAASGFDFGSLFAPSPAAKKPTAGTGGKKATRSGSMPVSPPTPTPSPGLFSFFGSSSESKSAPAPVPASPKKQSSSGGFSFFGGAKKPEPKIPNRGGTINLFGTGDSSPKKNDKLTDRPGTMTLFAAKKTRKQATPDRPGTVNLFNRQMSKRPDVKPPNRSGTISLLTSPKKKKQPVNTSGPSLSLFGGQAKNKQQAQQSAGGFSLFGGGGGSSAGSSASMSVVPGNVPVLSRWRQNPDGSVTGFISNSPSFRNGTEVTTSPVKRGAKKGSVIRTGSGSRYFLK